MEQGYREKKLGVGLGNLDLLYRCWEYSLGIVCSRLKLISFRTYSFESGDVFNCSACIRVSLCMGVWGTALPSPLLYQNVFLLLWLEPPSFLPAWAEILLLCVAVTQGEDGEGLPRMCWAAARGTPGGSVHEAPPFLRRYLQDESALK